MRVQTILGVLLVSAATSAMLASVPLAPPEPEQRQGATRRTDTQRIESVLVYWQGEAIEVEWVSWGGGGTALIKKARFASAPAEISFSPSSSLYLRFLRSGRSPVTISSLVIPTDRWVLQPPAAGGELVVRQPTAPVVPVNYVLIGHGEPLHLSPDNAGNFSLQGVPVGTYRLRGAYPGGLVGAEVDVAIARGQTATILPVPESVGGIQLTVSDERCLRTQEIRVSPVRTVRGGGTMKGAPLLNLSHEGICTRALGGITPGSYSVELVDGALNLSMVDEVAVSPQRVAELEFVRPLPWINGTVTFRAGAFPNVGASIVARPTQLDSPFRGVTVPLQAAGGFSFWLPEAGTYLVNLRIGNMIVLGHQRSFTAQEGFNQLDWDIDGALVRVNVADWDKSAPLSLELRRSGATTIGEPTATEWRLDAATATLPFVVPGLAGGSYRIQAWLRDRGRVPPMVSDVVRFEIRDGDVVRDLELALQPLLARVTLRDESSAPISGAVVGTRHGPMRETERGVYVAGDLPVGSGSEIDISASGFSPICRVLPTGGTLAAVMRRGATRVVEFVGEPELPRPVGSIFWPDSDCGVPLSQFSWTLVGRDRDARMVRFEIQSFPRASHFTWLPAVGYRPVSVAADQPGIVRLVIAGREPG